PVNRSSGSKRTLTGISGSKPAPPSATVWSATSSSAPPISIIHRLRPADPRSMLTSTFDPTSRLLTSKGQDQHTDTVCPHLTPGLAYLLAHESQVKEINRMAWSLIDLDIVLDQAEDPRTLPAELREGAGAEAWINFDAHYPL